MQQPTRNPSHNARPSLAARALTQVWWRLPLKRRARRQVKSFVFRILRSFIKNTRPYQNWLAIQQLSSVDLPADERLSYPAHWDLTPLPPPADWVAPAPLRKICFIVHAFYPDILSEILRRIADAMPQIEVGEVSILCSAPPDRLAEVRQLLAAGPVAQASAVAFENRGRDILPFLRLAADIDDNTLIVKLHTKRSDHRLTGQLWRDEILGQLISARNINAAVAHMNAHADCGIVGPRGHIVPMSLYFGGNALAISYLCDMMSVERSALADMSFVAGSMFFARPAALRPLLELRIPDSMFEAEAGQVDGTMAHAVERGFSLSCRRQKMAVTDTSFAAQCDVTSDHRFTW